MTSRGTPENAYELSNPGMKSELLRIEIGIGFFLILPREFELSRTD